MSTTSALGSTTSSYDALGVSQKPASNKKELGQADFLKLMTTQLQAQDPFKPMDSSQFLGQIAQFSQVTGLQSLNTSFSALSSQLTGNQTLQGVALVGRSVSVPGSTVSLPATGSVGASATASASGNVTFEIRDAAGSLVRTVDAGPQSAGRVDFSWDGLNDRGQRLPAGRYAIAAQLSRTGSDPVALATQVSATVSGVRNTASGLALDLSDGGSTALADVTAVH